MTTTASSIHDRSPASEIPEERHIPESTTTTSPTNKKLMLAAKVSLAALVALASLALSCALGALAIPMFTTGALGVCAGVVTMGAAVGIGVGGAILAPLRAAKHRTDRLLLNTTMGKLTDRNLKDCAAYVGNSVALSVLCALGLSILPAATLGFAFTGAVAVHQVK
jgi:hypothetical protein